MLFSCRGLLLGRDEAKRNTTAYTLLQSAINRIRPMPHENALSVSPFELRKFNASKHWLTMADCAWVFVRVNFHWQQPKPTATHSLIIIWEAVRA